MSAAKKKTATDATDPVSKRAELWKRLDRAELRRDKVGAVINRTQAECDDAHRALAQARIDEVVGDATPEDVEQLRAEVERLEQELKQANDEVQPVNKALTITRNEIKALHRRETDAFAAAAAPLVEDARAKLEALLPALREAHDAWQAAASFWSPIVRDAELSYVHAWPLISPAEAARTLRDVSPAPAEYAPTSKAKPVAPGTPKLYRRRDGMILNSREGEDGDNTLTNDPDFALIAVGRDDCQAVMSAERANGTR